MATAVTASRKRKRDEEKIFLGEPFVIQPHTSSVFESSVRVTPAVLLPRTFVPLQWLTGIPSRLFSAQIPPLETVPDNVLIIKTDGERQLSAVERISEGVYTLSKLSPNVKLKDVRKIGTMTRRIKPALPMAEEEGNKCLQKDWWADLVMDNISVSVGTALQMRRVPGGGSVVLSMLRGKNVEPQPETSSKKTEPLLLSPPQEFREPTPAEILEQTRAQYYETLYLAKTAIAYFAKSILSRARVMFQDGESESAQSPNRLIEFLQDMCIPLDKMDIKYRKTILQSATEDTVDDKAVYKDKEEEYVHRWVAKTFNDRMLQCNDQKLKRQTEDLKIRETELQIILLLEILALKKAQRPAVDEEPSKPEEETQSKDKPKAKPRKKSKKKAKDSSSAPDPDVLLDLLIDRLCIWRSIGSAATGAEPEGQENSNPEKLKDGGEDRLKHFCIEVVMAFYGSRLPEKCVSIQKKCGAGTPIAGNSSRPPARRHKKQPGLEKPPALSRSITAPASTTATASRAGFATATEKLSIPKNPWKSVDINAVATKKLQKRAVAIPALNKPTANVDEELKDAIKTLTKPNRAALGAEFMEGATRRLGGERGSIKKTKKPVRNPFATQVMATPSKRNRLKQRMQEAAQSIQEESEDEMTLPSASRTTSSQSQHHLSASNHNLFTPPLNTATTSNPFARISNIDVVPESSPVPIYSLTTPKKSSTFALQQSHYQSIREDDVVIDSSPIRSSVKPAPVPRAPFISKFRQRIAATTTTTITAAATTTTSIPRSTHLEDATALPSTPPLAAPAQTPTKKRRTTSTLGQGISLGFYEDKEELVPSSPFGGGVLLETPVKSNPTRRRFSGGGMSSVTSLGVFGTPISVNQAGTGTGAILENDYGISSIGESPVKQPARRRVSGGETRTTKALGSASSSLFSFHSQPPPPPAPAWEENCGVGDDAITSIEPEKEVSIYDSLGWGVEEDDLY